jgi:magnesium transporter
MMDVYTLDARGLRPKAPIHQLGQLAATPDVLVWVDMVDGNPAEMRRIAEQFSLHPLAIEDALEPAQRPKLESYQDHSFLVAYAYTGSLGDLSEVDVFVGHDWIVTVRNRNEAGEAWDPTRVRSRFDRQLPVELSVGFLLYAVLDDIVDTTFDAIEHLDDHLSDIEAEIFSSTVDDEDVVQQRLLATRRELLRFRSRILPAKDVLLSLARHEVAWLDGRTGPYFADALDHVVRTVDLIDLERELLSNAVDAHLAMVSNRMNQVMKRMTAGGSILLGAALIAGIYGMNFDTMPETHWGFGYPFAILSMLALTLGLTMYFKKQRYL